MTQRRYLLTNAPVWPAPPFASSPAAQTRSQAAGKPLKKPGAYNTDLYYQEKDEGYGDVGVDQVGCACVWRGQGDCGRPTGGRGSKGGRLGVLCGQV